MEQRVTLYPKVSDLIDTASYIIKMKGEFPDAKLEKLRCEEAMPLLAAAFRTLMQELLAERKIKVPEPQTSVNMLGALLKANAAIPFSEDTKKEFQVLKHMFGCWEVPESLGLRIHNDLDIPAVEGIVSEMRSLWEECVNYKWYMDNHNMEEFLMTSMERALKEFNAERGWVLTEEDVQALLAKVNRCLKNEGLEQPDSKPAHNINLDGLQPMDMLGVPGGIKEISSPKERMKLGSDSLVITKEQYVAGHYSRKANEELGLPYLMVLDNEHRDFIHLASYRDIDKFRKEGIKPTACLELGPTVSCDAMAVNRAGTYYDGDGVVCFRSTGEDYYICVNAPEENVEVIGAVFFKDAITVSEITDVFKSVPEYLTVRKRLKRADQEEFLYLAGLNPEDKYDCSWYERSKVFGSGFEEELLSWVQKRKLCWIG